MWVEGVRLPLSALFLGALSSSSGIITTETKGTGSLFCSACHIYYRHVPESASVRRLDESGYRAAI